LSGLFDFFQSASNTVADNVAGPVDLINSGLGLFGLRSKEPIGGSEWMKRWGLKRDVEMGGARIAGETAGLLSPALLAAKAPQIAKGLLQAQENAAIPRQMHPEMGAIVYHGSPHKFDKFDSSKIGTGEGAQAYGHGLYLADSADVARSYMNVVPDATTPTRRAFQGQELTPGSWEYKAASLLDGNNTLAGVRKEVAGWIKNAKPGEDVAGYQRTLEVLNQAKTKAEFKRLKHESNLYKVDLPDEAIAKMLDWDKPLKTNQSQYMPILKELGYLRPNDNGPRQYANAVRALGMERGGFDVRAADVGGEVLWKKLVDKHGSPDKAATWLQSQGIPGIRYLDGGSRGAGSGTSNYVVFPGEEHLLKILERNGGLMGP
jgi:hypothetical protein